MKYILGIQWLNQQLRIVCLKKDGKKVQLFKLATLDLLTKENTSVSSLVKEWLTENLSANAQVEAVLTIPESAIFLKELTMPLLKDAEMKEAIFWEAASAFPFSASEAVVGWQRIDKRAENQQVAIAAIKDSAIENYFESVNQLGVNILAIEPNSTSIARLIGSKISGTTLLVLIEDEETNFVVIRNGSPVFSTSFSISLAGMKKQGRRLDKTVKSVLAANAKKIINFWENREKSKIAQILIAGGGIKYSGLASAINHFAHVPVLIAKKTDSYPFTFTGQSKTRLSRFSVPLGAALKLVMNDKTGGLNLLPKKVSQILEKRQVEMQAQQEVSFLARLVLLLLGISLFVFGAIKFWSFSTERSLGQARVLLLNHPAQRLVAGTIETNKLLASASLLIERQKDLSQKLEQISKLVPVGLKFSSLQFGQIPEEQWEIKGIGGREEVLAFYYQLQTSPEILRVSMPYSNFQKDQDNNYKIVIVWQN